MTIFKCKMCGGDLEINHGMAIGTCQHCGSTMTLPKASDERVTNLFNRANHYRRSGEFDKAIGVYETIINEDAATAEAYWGMVLCRYGIEYVEDPESGQRIPTCHRAQKTTIFQDADYQQALEHADADARRLYEEEAKAIDGIQKQILTISAQEEPYDIFICYKETSETGSRTKDSVLAQDIYHHLTEDGYKVFFSRITLEDKLGSEYEPYIFAALNSSPVMIVVATSAEHANAVWTKNEWSRYLALINRGEKKTLIPVYRDMEAYELPEEFSHIQAQDMGRLGFMQDLVRGVKKIFDAGAKTEQVSITEQATQTGVTTQSLLDRAFISLEDEDWNKADELIERALDIEPRNAKAYIGKLMVDLKVNKEPDLAKQEKSIEEQNNYQKALRFAEGVYREVLEGYNQAILERIENEKLENVYQKLISDIKKCKNDYSYLSLAERFEELSGYQDADELAIECRRKAQDVRIAREKAEAEARLERERQAEIRRQAKEKQIQVLKKTALIGTPFILIAIAFIYLLNNVFIPLNKYNSAVSLMEQGQYIEAENIFASLGEYKDSKTMVHETKYRHAMVLLDIKDYEASFTLLTELGDFRDSEAMLLDNKYHHAIELMDVKDYDAATILLIELDDYRNSKKLLSDIAETYISSGQTQGYYLEALVSNNSFNDLQSYFIMINSIISAGSNHTVGLKSDGTVVAVGDNSHGQLNVESWQDIVAVAAGSNHTVGLKSDGTVVAVGDSAHGRLDVESWRKIAAITAGAAHTVGLKLDGIVVAVGDNSHGQLDVESWRDVAAITAGNTHTVGLKLDGTAVAVGSNAYGELNVESWRDIVAVSAGYKNTIGLKPYGTVVAVGSDSDGRLDIGDWRGIVAISAGRYHTVGLRVDGTVVAAGEGLDGRLDVKDWHDIVAISAGRYHTVGLRVDGTVVAVGKSSHGQLEVEDWVLSMPTLTPMEGDAN